MRQLECRILVACVTLLLGGCGPGGGMVDVSGSASAPTQGAARLANAPTASAVYKVQRGDVIEVSVYQLPDLSRVAEVDGAGNINLALVGAVPASGRTVRQLEEEIGGRYRARYLQNPQVSVSLKDAVGMRVTIDGAVKRPGTIMARGDMTLLRALAEAQGFSDVADQSGVILMRNTPQGRSVERFDANAIRSGTMADPQILGGDTIVVDDSTAKTAFKYLREVVPVAGILRPF